MTNLNYLFNVEYYKRLDRGHLNNCNKKLFEQTFHAEPAVRNAIPVFTDRFVLKVADYPGLLIGLGYVHAVDDKTLDSGESKEGNQIGLGFTLNYVTGLPYIPGSTVKGVLRSAFFHHPEYVFESVLTGSLKTAVNNADDVWEKIGVRLFGDSREGEGGCVFFDAFPVKTAPSGKMLAKENITPHKVDKPDYGLKNPIPLTLLKVIGGTEFLFRFDMSRIQELEHDEIIAAFRKILLDLGIGAKTNVGFGGLTEGTEQETYYELGYDASSVAAAPNPAGAGWRRPAVQRAAPSGTCEDCGGKTGINKTTGEYYRRCSKCSAKPKR